MLKNEKEYFGYNLTELIDLMSNLQIKETKFDDQKFADEIVKVQADIDEIALKKEIKISGNIIRKIILAAVSNLMVWEYKDEMLNKPTKYNKILKKALEVNSVRNASNNSLMKDFLEDDIVKKKITKFTKKDSNWVSFMKDKINEL